MADEYTNRQLPKWLRAVELEPGGPRLEAIEGAATNLAETLTGGDILDMALLAHGRSHGEIFDHLNDSLRDHDPTFGCSADDLESTIAAGAVVSALMANESKSASIAAQGVLSAQWVGLSSAIAELPEIAAATCFRRSEALRARSPLPAGPVKRDFLKKVPEFDSEEPATQQDIGFLRRATKDLSDGVQARVHAYGRVLAARLDAADEELEVLWWAFSGHSELAMKEWGQLAGPEGVRLFFVDCYLAHS